MKQCFIICLLFCWGALQLEAQVQLKKHQIAYDTNYLLVWDDFITKRKPPSSPEAAEAALNLYFSAYYHEDSGRYVLEVVAAFDRKLSWVRKDAKNDAVLNHEQLHFDIEELFARKLRKAFFEQIQSVQDIEKKAEKLLKQYSRDLARMQKAYDKETHHGLNKAAQQSWDQKIRSELKLLDDYVVPLFVVR